MQLDYFLGPQEVKSGLGSGFIWNTEGYIVTNFHVIKDANSIRVTLPSNKTLQAKFIGAEPERDIAVIKLVGTKLNLNPIKIGDSDTLKTGQDAIAIGNPFGLDHSMSRGIISALGRSAPSLVNGVTIRDMIQTDAAINPGNSGGPLLNSSGELIGMNTQIYSPSGSSSGVGFAVPQKTISRIVPQLIQHGKVIKPSLGIMHNAHLQNYLSLRTEGVLIADTQRGGPADQAGLVGIRRNKMGEFELGDIITQIDQFNIKSYDDLYNALDPVSYTHLTLPTKRIV